MLRDPNIVEFGDLCWEWAREVAKGVKEDAVDDNTRVKCYQV